MDSLWIPYALPRDSMDCNWFPMDSLGIHCGSPMDFPMDSPRTHYGLPVGSRLHLLWIHYDSRRSSTGFPMDSRCISYRFPVDFLSIRDAFSMDSSWVSLWISNGFHKDSKLIPDGFPFDLRWSSCGFAISFPRISKGLFPLYFQQGFLVDPLLDFWLNGSPMDSIWIPYGFPMHFLSIYDGVLVDLQFFHGFPKDPFCCISSKDSLWIPYWISDLMDFRWIAGGSPMDFRLICNGSLVDSLWIS